MWLYVWGHNQTLEWGITWEHRFVRQRMLCMPNKRDILEGNFWCWMNDLENQSLPLQSHVGLITISSNPTSPPTPLHQCYHLLPTPQCQASKRATSLLTLPLQTLPSWYVFLPETWSAWNNIKEVVLLWFFFPKASLHPSFYLLSISPSPLPLMSARCSHLWRHYLNFPPFRQKYPEIDRKASSGDEARAFSASQSMSWC